MRALAPPLGGGLCAPCLVGFTVIEKGGTVSLHALLFRGWRGAHCHTQRIPSVFRFSLTPSGRTRLARSFATTAFTQPLSQDRVGDMLRALGDQHIGFASCHADDLAMTFVGARPFSRGGTEWDLVADFYRDRYGVHSLEDSASRIASLLQDAPADHACVVIGHSGPTGAWLMNQ